jgi:hypothetical protein
VIWTILIDQETEIVGSRPEPDDRIPPTWAPLRPQRTPRRGDGLHDLFNDPKQPAYVALLTGDKSGKLGHCKESLISSLKPHTRNEKDEIVFHDSNIILNITDALYSTFFTTLTPERLFSCCDDNQLRTACLYWQDRNYAVRTVESNSIIGPRGRASTLESVSSICRISLPYRKKWDYCTGASTAFSIQPA